MTDQMSDPMKGYSGALPDLLRAYQQQHEAWRAAAAEVARLRNEVLGAANLEATTLMNTARADVGRVVRTTREKLAQLIAQTRAVVEHDPIRLPDSLAPPSSAVVEESSARLLSSSDEILQVLTEAVSDLEALTRDALQLSTTSIAADQAHGGEPPVARPIPPTRVH